MESIHSAQPRAAWNKGKLVGQKTPFKLFEITAQIREALETRIKRAGLKSESFLFPSRVSTGARRTLGRFTYFLGTRSWKAQYDISA
jgi:hypothetical protein